MHLDKNQDLIDSMSMFRRVFIQLLLPFLLLFAQGGAIAHSVTHLALPAPSQHDKQLPHSPVCDKCVVYAEVGGAIPITAAVFTPQQFDAIASSFSSPVFFVSVAYRSNSPRAPPSLV